MALIPCPNCGSKVSTKADSCPRCESPLNAAILDAIPVARTRRRAPQADPVRVRFLCQGKWMLFDAQVTVLLDGDPIGKGSVKNGFDILVTTTLGEHDVEVSHASVVSSPRHQLDFPEEGSYEVELAYSRTWGNFSPPPKVVFVD